MLFQTEPKEGASRAKKLISEAYDDWKHAKQDLKMHAKLQYHLNLECRMQWFVDTMQNADRRINVVVYQQNQELIIKNCGYIKSIIKYLEFAARQGIALRGHRDDSTSSDEEHQEKFRALIDFRVDSGDRTLKEHLDSCRRHATYISKTIQNDLLQCMGNYIQSQNIAQVKNGCFYGIMADEVTDVSVFEQVGVALRYVQNCVAVERLVEFSSVRGEDLSGHLLPHCRN